MKILYYFDGFKMEVKKLDFPSKTIEIKCTDEDGRVFMDGYMFSEESLRNKPMLKSIITEEMNKK
jgi:hypothetical protein